MNSVYRVLAVALSVTLLAQSGSAQAQGMSEMPAVGNSPEWVIAIHGGAGSASRADLSADAEKQLATDLRAALEAGAALLDAGAEGPAAIEAALRVLEDSPHFNAGRGAALNEHGQARHDASIMRGEDLGAGAVAGSSRIRNPIAAARAVMEQTQNVLLHGEGADWFAAEAGLEMANPLYFVTERKREALLEQRARDPEAETVTVPHHDGFYGTVGAVVLDRQGNISAGTSTGGRTNKRYGRVGDTPLIGAGTYASNSSCAVSGTGHGEYFMRWTVARDICARVEFAGESLEEASRKLMIDMLLPEGGTGGVIALEPSGNVVFVMTTANMKRGVMSSNTPARVAVYSNDEIE